MTPAVLEGEVQVRAQELQLVANITDLATRAYNFYVAELDQDECLCGAQNSAACTTQINAVVAQDLAFYNLYGMPIPFFRSGEMPPNPNSP